MILCIIYDHGFVTQYDNDRDEMRPKIIMTA